MLRGVGGKRNATTPTINMPTKTQPAMLTAANKQPGTTEEEFHLLPLGTIVKGRWKLLKRIGQGAFGQTFLAEDLLSDSLHKHAAVKVEFSDALIARSPDAPSKVVVPKKQVLRLEVAILKRLQGVCPFVCEFISCGKIPDGDAGDDSQTASSTFMVMQLLGENLADLRKQRVAGKFSVATTALLMKQMLAAIRCLHSIGYLHRDVKPSNFVMGLTKDPLLSGRQRCYMVDFGLCRRYLSTDGRVRQPRDRAGFRGTARYSSINSHLNKELGRRDDLWSLFYVMIEFLKGNLPWRREKDRDKVGVLKLKMTSPALVEDLPAPCLDFYRCIQSLEYADMPDYDRLERILDDLFQCAAQPTDVPYDWSDNSSTVSHDLDECERDVGKELNGGAIAEERLSDGQVQMQQQLQHQQQSDHPAHSAVAGEDSDEEINDLQDRIRQLFVGEIRPQSAGSVDGVRIEVTRRGQHVAEKNEQSLESNSQQVNENVQCGGNTGSSCQSLTPKPPSTIRSIGLPVFKARLKRYRLKRQ